MGGGQGGYGGAGGYSGAEGEAPPGHSRSASPANSQCYENHQVA